jgi:Flavin reductase like domain
MFRASSRPVTCGRCLSTTPDKNTCERLRSLLRETAQPVAVVPICNIRPRTMGATLSSSTSIAMDPHLLISFSLRIPSRMATALKAADSHSKSQMVIIFISSPGIYSRTILKTGFISRAVFIDTISVERGGSAGVGRVFRRVIVKGSWPLHDLYFIEGPSTRGAIPGELLNQ